MIYYSVEVPHKDGTRCAIIMTTSESSTWCGLEIDKEIGRRMFKRALSLPKEQILYRRPGAIVYRVWKR